jgi:uncharacterized protein (TIGR03083 family)
MTVTATEIDALVDAERSRLSAVLDGLDDAGWGTPSLCAGWSVRDAVAHLLMPYELSVPGFLAKLVAARFSFDTLADRWARRDPRSPAALLAALRATAQRRWNVPGSPPEAPLSHLVLHGEDVLRPLGVEHRVDARAAELVLDQCLTPRAEGLRAAGLIDGVTLVASDLDWRRGDGPEVIGTASALLTTLAGRSAALGELSGPGADAVRERVGQR